MSTVCEPCDLESAPDMLEAKHLRYILGSKDEPRGINQVYAWMDQHPGLVVRCGGKTKFVPKVRLRLFFAGDPAVMALAFTDPYAKPQQSAGTPLLRMA